MLKIQNGNHLTLKEIHEFHQAGGSVVRSCHFGNLTLSTLFIAQEGFHLLLDEGMRGFRSYKPAYLLLAGEYLQIFKNTQIVASHVNKIRENKVPQEFKYISAHATTPCQFHDIALQQLKLPQTTAWSAYFILHREITQPFLNILGNYFLDAFDEYVDEDGYVYFRQPEQETTTHQTFRHHTRGDKQIANKELVSLVYANWENCKNGLEGRPVEFKPGVILNGVPVTLLISLIEANLTQKNNLTSPLKLLHFAGLHSMDYLLFDAAAKKNQEWMQNIFNRVTQHYASLVPDDIDLLLITTKAINKLVSLDAETDKRYSECLINNTAISYSEIELSQYDLISSQKSLYFPDAARNWSQNILNEKTK